MQQDAEVNVSIEQLNREVQTLDSEVTGGEPASQHSSQELVDDVVNQLLPDRLFKFDDKTVKNSLDEVLLLLIAHSDESTHGKALMNKIAAVFDSQLSPGTVYPCLHELEERGLVEVNELVRKKEYLISDKHASRMAIQRAMIQHIVLGYVLFSSLEEL
ncbi:MAG: PadR family transcriptional regulator [Halovenus sp.]